uniref:Uncharacterized protein n=1 Tax=Tanacetum cinerariifolium TaxID=118510 RepID=A0A6L2M801_TANCI|nr:hypothetical protein [Tanacetum cinerariifolium]
MTVVAKGWNILMKSRWFCGGRFFHHLFSLRKGGARIGSAQYGNASSLNSTTEIEDLAEPKAIAIFSHHATTDEVLLDNELLQEKNLDGLKLKISGTRFANAIYEAEVDDCE